jgi:hypothetical protein
MNITAKALTDEQSEVRTRRTCASGRPGSGGRVAYCFFNSIVSSVGLPASTVTDCSTGPV